MGSREGRYWGRKSTGQEQGKQDNQGHRILEAGGGGGGEGECLQERGEERLGSRILKVMEGIVKKFSLSNIPSFLYKSIENHKN